MKHFGHIWWGLMYMILLKTSTTQGQASHNALETGRHLAQRYCQGCHQFPSPTLLDKQTWLKNVLPNMGYRLGIKNAKIDPLSDLPQEEVAAIKALNIYPATPQLTETDWLAIVNYYEQLAPDTLTRVPPQTFSQLQQFVATPLKIHDKPIPKTTLLKFNTADTLLYVGDAHNELYVVNGTFSLKTRWEIDSPPADIDFPPHAPPRLLTMGFFSPSEQRIGQLFALDTLIRTPHLPGLPRPVQFASADLNEDGREDVVVCGFGNHSGELAWYEHFDSTQKHVLKALPGARKAEIADLNHDNKPDIVVLMAQAQEEVVVYYNRGKGRFEEKKLLQFPPVYGVSFFELVDFNRDGFLDILLTNGDNWDYSPILKNYHGVRLYFNDGKDNFSEKWFFPMYGTSKAIARDFDGDGDLDLAAISFYNDLENPENSFVYLANEGNLKFSCFTTALAAQGKWLTMEAADFDHDGDTDLVLGSYFQTVGELTKLVAKGILSFPQLLLLTNQHVKK